MAIEKNERKIIGTKKNPPRIFLAQLGNLAKKKSLKLIEEFRKEKIQVLESLGKDVLKTQLKLADKAGVSFTLILGQKEALEKTIIIRDMVNGKQETVKIEKIMKEIRRRLKSK